MLPFEDRYTRQRRLPEVGEAGQARLGQAEAVVRGNQGADVEQSYLERAGVTVRREPEAAPLPFLHAAAFRFEASRGVAAGAWRALVAIRRELGIGER